MNEIMVVSAEMMTTFDGLKDVELKTEALKFCELGKSTLRNTYEQYKVLERIQKKKLYLKDFQNGKMSDKEAYGACVHELFGISASQAYRMVQVSETFLHGEYAEKFMEFTPTALLEMLPNKEERQELTAHKKELLKLIDNGSITPDDTRKDVKEIVNRDLRGKTETASNGVKVEKPKKGERVAKLMGDLTSYAKKKKDKYLTDLVKELQKEIEALAK